ncbi:MAG: hypothetical protein FWC39_02060 [Bacteroidetes bacterium]|nr:hypothetical protein [Bacteroidota bacterium]
MPQQKITTLFCKYPKFFRDIISAHYPLTNNQLSTYKDFLNWEFISMNPNIQWSHEILSKFKKLINWQWLSINIAAFEDLSLLDKFEDYIHWQGGGYYGDTIINNSGIFWTTELIDKYAHKIDFKKIGRSNNIQWSEELIEKHKDKWNWKDFLNSYDGCAEFPWTMALFEKYLGISYLHNRRLPDSLISVEFVEKYHNYLNWEQICSNPRLPWEEENLLKKWEGHIDWKGIARNPYFFKTDKDFFQKHYDIWTQNKQEYFMRFSYNEAFPWTKELVDTHKEYINWKGLCGNEGIAWDKEMIDYFKEYVDWYSLRGNISALWSIDLLLKYEHKINFCTLWLCFPVWKKAFAPYVNDELIGIVIEKQNKN